MPYANSNFMLVGPDGQPISQRQMNRPGMGNSLKEQQMQQEMGGADYGHLQQKQKPMKNKNFIMKAMEGAAEGLNALNF